MTSPNDVPLIPSETPGSSSRYKGVSKDRNQWKAWIRIESEEGQICLGTFATEEKAGVMYARARYKYPPLVAPNKPKLDLSQVPSDLGPIPAARKNGSSRFQGVSWVKKIKTWRARIKIRSDRICLGTFESEEEAGVEYARACWYRNNQPVEGK